MKRDSQIMRRSEGKGNAMSTHRIFRGALALIVVGMSASCGDLLDVEPINNVGPGAATGDISGVRSIVTQVYSQIQDANHHGMEFVLLGALMADNARPSAPPVRLTGAYSDPSSGQMGSWGGFYDAINEANFAIWAARNLLDAEPELASRYIGEALFLRAMFYFDLSRVFSYEPGHYVDGWDKGVVLRLEPTQSAEQADFRARSTVEEVYAQIEADLLEAIDRLAQHGEDNVFRATQAGAEALLAKVYLYWSKWSDAITYATAALSHTSARLAQPEEVAGMFSTAPNVESVFEVNYNAATETLWVNDCKACQTWPPGTWFAVWPSDELLALFEPADARQALYPTCPQGCPATAPAGLRYLNKYTEARGQWTDNTPVIRYSDLLLMRAEAYAETGQDALARADLNTLRAARNVGPITSGGASLIDDILTERRRELAFEASSRWFDLKRRGMDITRPAYQGNPTLPYTDYRILAGIPDNQVTNNALLEQNPGY